MSYQISSLDKGVVDESVMSKLDSNFRRKMLIGDNIYITPENTIKTRPDIKEIENTLDNVVDAIEYDKRTVYLQRWDEQIVQDFNGTATNAGDTVELTTGITTDLASAASIIPEDIVTTVARNYFARGGANIPRVTPSDNILKFNFSAIKLDDSYVVTLTEPDLFSDRTITAVYILKRREANISIQSIYFTDTKIANRLGTDTRTNTYINEGNWLVSNETYLPSNMVFNHVNNTLTLNMLGRLYQYNGDSFSLKNGSEDVLDNRSVGDFIKTEVEMATDDIPLIVQVFPYMPDLKNNLPYVVTGTRREIENISNHDLDNLTADGKAFVPNVISAFASMSKRLQFSLLEMNPDCTSDTDYKNPASGITGGESSLRFIMPDVKVPIENSALSLYELISSTRLGSTDNYRQVFIGEAKANVRSNSGQAASLKASNNYNDPRFDGSTTTNPNGTGSALDGLGVTLWVQDQELTEDTDRVIPINSITANKAFMRIYIDYSHPKTIEVMNKIKYLSGFRTILDRAPHSDILINVDSKESSNTAVTNANTYNDEAKTSIAATADSNHLNTTTLGIIMVAPTADFLYRMVSSKSLNVNSGDNKSAIEAPTNSAYNSISRTRTTYDAKQVANSLHPIYIKPTYYRTLNESDVLGFINNRLIVSSDTVNYSKYNSANILNEASKEFINNTLYTTRDIALLSEGGFDINIVVNANDPQQFRLRNEQVTNISLLDVRSNNQGIITTDKRLLRAANNGAGEIPAIVEIDDVGCDPNALTKYTASIISSQDGHVRQSLYSERVNGFVSNLINKETKLPKIIDMVQMITKHRVVLCLHEKQEDEEQLISCFSLGSEAQIKGLTKWRVHKDIGFVATKFVKESEDKVLLIGNTGIRRINLSDEGFTGDDGVTADNGALEHPIQWVIQPTPIRFNSDNFFSVQKPIPIPMVVIGVFGEPVFTFKMIDREKRNHPVIKEYPVRLTDGNEGAITSGYNGIVLIQNIGNNASRLPTIQLEGNGSVLTITSIDVQIGTIR